MIEFLSILITGATLIVPLPVFNKFSQSFFEDKISNSKFGNGNFLG